MPNTIIGESFERLMNVERVEDETYRASFSSEKPCARFFGIEVLSHEESAVDLSRAGARGLPLLFNHAESSPLGRVKNIRIDDGRLVGDLVFSKRKQAQEFRQDVDDGMLTDMSVRYTIDDYEMRTEGDTDVYTITRWTPLEASLVSVPADHTVGVGRSRATGKSKKEIEMGDEATGNRRDGEAGVDVAGLNERRKRIDLAAQRDGARLERERIQDIERIFSSRMMRSSVFHDLRRRCIDDGLTPDASRALALEMLDETGAANEPATTIDKCDDHGNSTRGASVFAGKDGAEKIAEGLTRAIEAKAGLGEDESSNEFRGLSLVEMGRAWAQRNNLSVAGMDANRLVGFLLTSGRRTFGHGTDDFAGILANVAHKSLLRGWEIAPTTYQAWCRIGTLNDFKRTNRTGLGGASMLEVVGENSEYKYGTSTDRTEYIQAVTYGSMFKLSRQAIVNDDLAAFSDQPRNMGIAARRTINKAVYASLTSASGVGPTLNQDSTALFHSNHANYDASSGGINVTNLDAGRQKMAKQTDPNNGEPLNISPKFLLVPVALQTLAEQLVASVVDPHGLASAAGGAWAPNPFSGKLNVIAEPYLDSATNGTTAWYLLADGSLFDTYEVGFLNGQTEPYMEERVGWNTDGLEWKVRIDAGIAPLDYRAMYRKRGA